MTTLDRSQTPPSSTVDGRALAEAWDAWQAEGGGDTNTTEAGRRYQALLDVWVDAAQRQPAGADR